MHSPPRVKAANHSGCHSVEREGSPSFALSRLPKVKKKKSSAAEHEAPYLDRGSTLRNPTPRFCRPKVVPSQSKNNSSTAQRQRRDQDQERGSRSAPRSNNLELSPWGEGQEKRECNHAVDPPNPIAYNKRIIHGTRGGKARRHKKVLYYVHLAKKGEKRHFASSYCRGAIECEHQRSLQKKGGAPWCCPIHLLPFRHGKRGEIDLSVSICTCNRRWSTLNHAGVPCWPASAKGWGMLWLGCITAGYNSQEKKKKKTWEWLRPQFIVLHLFERQPTNPIARNTWLTAEKRWELASPHFAALIRGGRRGAVGGNTVVRQGIR